MQLRFHTNHVVVVFFFNLEQTKRSCWKKDRQLLNYQCLCSNDYCVFMEVCLSAVQCIRQEALTRQNSDVFWVVANIWFLILKLFETDFEKNKKSSVNKFCPLIAGYPDNNLQTHLVWAQLLRTFYGRCHDNVTLQNEAKLVKNTAQQSWIVVS